MSKQLNVGQTVQGFLDLYDDITGQRIPAAFDNQNASSSNENVATATLSDDPSFMNFNGISQGEATITVSGTAHYTNSAGANVSQDKTTQILIQVFAPSNSTTMKIDFF